MIASVVLAVVLVAVTLASVPATPVAAGPRLCKGCETAVGFIEGWLKANKTAPAIEKDLEKACALIPGIAAVCDTLVDVGIPKIIGWIEAKESPEKICDKIHLCNSTAPPSVAAPARPMKLVKPVKPVKAVANSETCEGCEYVIGAVESWMKSGASEQEIESLLENACTLVPAFQSTCNAAIEAGVPALIGWITEHENATVVCGQLALCSTSQQPPVAVKQSRSVAAGNDCGACKMLIGSIEQFVLANETVQMIETTVQDSLCKLFPAFEKSCDALAKVGIPDVVAWLKANEDPDTVCQQLGVCASSATKPVVAVPPLKSDCTECQSVIAAMEHWLAQNSSVTYITELLEDTLCKFIPSYEATCDAIFDNGVPTVIQWIEEAEDPKTVCTQLGVCTSSATKPVLALKHLLAARKH